MNPIVAFVLGVLAGWLFKIPFLLKWYRELKETKDYIDAMRIKQIREQFLKIHGKYLNDNL